jgi:outer membrane lipoprotein-sorting protein
MSRLRRIGIVATVVVFFGYISATEANAQLDVVLKRMDDHNKALSALKASVTMAKQDSALGDDAVITKGTAIYVPRPGKDAWVRIDWESPKESVAVLNGEYVVYRYRLNQGYKGKVSSAKKGPSGSNALSFMNMNRAQLRANYSIVYGGQATLDGGIETWHLKLTPKTASSYQFAEVWVDKDGMPTQMKVVEKNNDTTTVRLSNVDKTVKLKSTDFVVTVPKTVEWLKS